MVSRLEARETREMLSKACNDLQCAIKSNPDALKNITIPAVANFNTPPQTRYINISLIGIICAKIGLYLGLH